MRITFTQSGGFAGAVRGCRIDTAALAPEERLHLETLVDASDLKESIDRHAEAGRDLRQYAIHIERDGATVRACCDDRSVPPALRPLLNALAARATPQRPGWEEDGPAEQHPLDA
jgi:hypothetical protein